jgi:hypothetical protein
MIQNSWLTATWLMALASPLGWLLLFFRRTRPTALALLLGALSSPVALGSFEFIRAMIEQGFLHHRYMPLVYWSNVHAFEILPVVLSLTMLLGWVVVFEVPARLGEASSTQKLQGRRGLLIVFGLVLTFVGAREIAARLSLPGRIYLAAEKALEGPEPHQLVLADVATFDWDRVVVLNRGECLPVPEGFEDLVSQLPTEREPFVASMGYPLESCFEVFMRGSERVLVNRQLAKQATFFNWGSTRILTRDQAVFSVSKSESMIGPVVSLEPVPSTEQ